MKTEMRRELARQPFEQKIRKIGQLIQLSAKLKVQRTIDTNFIPAAGMEATGLRRRQGTLRLRARLEEP